MTLRTLDSLGSLEGKRVIVQGLGNVGYWAARLIADLGCKVVSSESGEQALAMLETNGVDIIISDVVMPGMSGVELARRLRKARPEVPVLLATGYSDEIVSRGSEFQVLAKPFGAADLSKAIASVLNGPSRTSVAGHGR